MNSLRNFQLDVNKPEKVIEHGATGEKLVDQLPLQMYRKLYQWCDKYRDCKL